MTVDKEVIRSRLVRLNRPLGRIEGKRPDPLNLLLTDPDVQSIAWTLAVGVDYPQRSQCGR